jgi:hypothetical protein
MTAISENSLPKLIYPDNLLGTDNIRLLELHPGQVGDPIQCDLKAVSLASISDSYEAISYV